MVGFDADIYPADDTKAATETIADGARSELANWASRVGHRISTEKLANFEIEFFCVPIPSADGFRSAFLEALGLKK